jgi:hypothetical protein
LRKLGACLAMLGVLWAGAAGAREVCALPPARVIEQSGDPHAPGGRLLQVWEVADAAVWWSDADPSGYGAFRAKVAKLAGETDPVKLLAQVRSPNNRIVAERAADWIGPANCLEKLLQQMQDDRIDTFARPTEFAAVVLRSADGATLRIYFYTVNEDGIGRMTPVSAPATADYQSGWKVLGTLHNHAFHPGQPELNGPLAPSKPDGRFIVNFAASAGLAEAWITNGLHTARIPAAAFGLFERD